MIKDLLNKAKKELKELGEITGVEFVTEEVRDNRKAECEKRAGDCFYVATRQCKVCTCFIDIKTKLKKLPFEGDVKCPNNHW